MRVAILGAGAIAYGAAALLARAGHDPCLWSPSGERTRALAAGADLRATGAVKGVFKPRIADAAGDAVVDADLVLIAVPAYGHRAVFEAAAPHLAADQVVAISSHASFGALALTRLLEARGLALPVVAWGTTVTSGRQPSPTEVTVSTVRARVDAAVVPRRLEARGLAVCQAAFGDRFVGRDGLLAIALSNLNPQNHMGIALCNLTRMEKGETWNQGEHVTPAVGRLLEALDAERLAIAAAVGVDVRTIFEHFHLSFHVPVASISAMNQRIAAEGRGGAGPATADSRYVLEDVPFGLVPTARLGRLAGRPAALHEAGIRVFGALYGRNFEAENDLLEPAGVLDIDLAELRRRCQEG